MNLTGKACSTTFLKPVSQPKCEVSGVNWVKVRSFGFDLHFAVCHDSNFGDIPGYALFGKCYFEFAKKVRVSKDFSFVGIYNGGYSFCTKKYSCKCLIYGGYQLNTVEPLYLCVAKLFGYLIPGKLDKSKGICWFSSLSTKDYYAVVAM